MPPAHMFSSFIEMILTCPAEVQPIYSCSHNHTCSMRGFDLRNHCLIRCLPSKQQDYRVYILRNGRSIPFRPRLHSRNGVQPGKSINGTYFKPGLSTSELKTNQELPGYLRGLESFESASRILQKHDQINPQADSSSVLHSE